MVNDINNDLDRIVNQFNAKVRKLVSQGIKYLPDEIDKNLLLETYKYEPQELTQKLLDLEKFNQTGAESIISLKGGAKITDWQHRILQQDVKVLKDYINKEIESYGATIPKVYGKVQARTYAQMGDTRYENLLRTKARLDKTEFKSQQELKRFLGTVLSLNKRRLTGDYIFKESYIEFIHDICHDAGIDPQLEQSVVEKLEQVNAHDFYNLYLEEESMKHIRDSYNSTKIITHSFSEEDVTLLISDLVTLDSNLTKILESNEEEK